MTKMTGRTTVTATMRMILLSRSKINTMKLKTIWKKIQNKPLNSLKTVSLWRRTSARISSIDFWRSRTLWFSVWGFSLLRKLRAILKMYLVWWAKSRGMMPLNLSTTSLMLLADISKRMLSSKKRSIQWLWILSRLRMKNCGTPSAWDLERFILNSTATLSLMICSVCSRTVAARRK